MSTTGPTCSSGTSITASSYGSHLCPSICLVITCTQVMLHAHAPCTVHMLYMHTCTTHKTASGYRGSLYDAHTFWFVLVCNSMEQCSLEGFHAWCCLQVLCIQAGSKFAVNAVLMLLMSACDSQGVPFWCCCIEVNTAASEGCLGHHRVSSSSSTSPYCMPQCNLLHDLNLTTALQQQHSISIDICASWGPRASEQSEGAVMNCTIKQKSQTVKWPTLRSLGARVEQPQCDHEQQDDSKRLTVGGPTANS